MKTFVKKYVNKRLDVALALMEERAKEILNSNDFYKDLYIDPDVDIVNSHPQVIQQVKEELIDFLKLLQEHDVKDVLQIGLGHWASTHFALSLLTDYITTIEYDIRHIERYLPESCLDCEQVIHGNSLEVHKDLEDEHFDVVFIDGNHSYNYVKQDLENYSKKVKSGGIIALHDANFEGDQYGTPKVLRESGYDWTFISHSKEVGIAYRIKE